MTLATLNGRLQTKLVSYILLGLLSIPFAALFGIGIWQLLVIAIPVGLILEAIWGIVIEHQPGWLAFILAILEFLCITAIALLISAPITIGQAALYYGITWILIQLFFLYFFPVIHPSWADNGSEIW